MMGLLLLVLACVCSAQLTSCPWCPGDRTVQSAIAGASEVMACSVRSAPVESGELLVYKDFECHVDGKGVCISNQLAEIRQKFKKGAATCTDVLTRNKKWKVTGVCSGQTLLLDECGLLEEVKPSRIGTCAWCGGGRSNEGVAAAAKSILMVTITGDAREVTSKDEKGTTRVYGGIKYAVEKTEMGDFECKAQGISTLRQEVTFNNEKQGPESVVCRDLLPKNTIWRLSGRCFGDVFYADPCGLTERVGVIKT